MIARKSLESALLFSLLLCFIVSPRSVNANGICSCDHGGTGMEMGDGSCDHPMESSLHWTSEHNREIFAGVHLKTCCHLCFDLFSTINSQSPILSAQQRAPQMERDYLEGNSFILTAPPANSHKAAVKMRFQKDPIITTLQTIILLC